MELESLLRVAVAATLLTVSVQGALATKLNVNLVTNPGFESGNTRWTSTNGTWGTNVTTSSAAAHSGTAGLSITGSDLWVYQTVRSLEDFTTYRLSTWFKGTNISDRIGIKLEFLDANDAAIPSTSYTYYFNK